MRTILLGLAMAAIYGLMAAGGADATAGAAITGGYRLVGQWPDGRNVSGPGQFDDPHGIDVTGAGDVYVADSGSSRVQQFTAEGQFVADIGAPGSGAGALTTPMDVAATAARLYVTDRAKQAVMVYGRDGKFITSWTGFAAPWGIAVGGNGDVYVADSAAGKIIVLNSDGLRLGTISQPGVRQDDLSGPRGIDFAADGALYVADNGNQRVQVFRPGGLRVDTITMQQINPALAAPVEDVSNDGAGNLFVLTGQFMVRLSRDASRRYQLQDACAVGGGAGLDVDQRQGVYVTRYNRALLQSEVMIFPYLGRCGDAKRFGAFGGVVRLQNPTRVTAGPNGSVALVSDAGVTLHETDGRLRGVLPGTTPPTQGVVQNADLRVRELAFVADGAPVVGNGVGAQRLGPNGAAVWKWPEPPTPTMPPLIGAPWLTGMAYDAAADRLHLLDIGHNLLAVRTADGSIVADQALAVPGGFAAYRDLALMPGGYLAVVNQSNRQIEVRSRDWQLVGTIAPPSIPTRLATSGTHIFVLTRDGYLWRYEFTPGQAPTLETVWKGDGAAGGRPADLEVIGDHVYVLDSATGQVFVWAPDAAGSPDPPSPATGLPSRCNVDGVALLDPDVVLAGEPFGVSLSVGGACPDTTPRTDIVLVVDRSGSMLAAGKMEAAKLAFTNFVTGVDYTQSQVGLVSFSTAASLDLPLTADRQAAVNAVAGLVAVGGTDIAAGIDVAAQELGSPRHRSDAQGVIILLTDGVSDERSALVSALETQLDGNRMFVIGLGEDVNSTLLTRLATTPQDYYFTPDPAKLAVIYQTISRRIRAEVLFKQLAIHYELPTGIRFVEMDQGPDPVATGDSLDWDLGQVGFAGTEIAFKLVGDIAGQQPAARRIALDLVDGLGGSAKPVLGVPQVTILRPDRLLTATPTPTPLPTPTPEPRPIYLPYALRKPCVATQGFADVALVIDASGSMLDATANGLTKIAAAKEAAVQFADVLHLPDDQAAIVQFNSAAQILLPLSGDIGDIQTALDHIATAAGTRIDLGLQEGMNALSGPEAHAKRSKAVLVLLTDGLPTGTTAAEVIAASAAIKARGVELFTVGLGTDLDPELLRRVATDSSHAFLVPDITEVASIYARIAATIPCQ